MHSDRDIKQAVEFREEIHKQALAKARALYPAIDTVIDEHPIDDYFTEYWDYPGKWYVMITIPAGFKTREELIDKIAADTVEYYLGNNPVPPEEPFWEIIKDYPDMEADYAIVTLDTPYCGYRSHYDALKKGATKILADEWKLNFNVADITADKISVRDFLAPVDKDGELNYRKAFLMPPYQNNYTDADFEKVNSVLFPNGTENLEIYKWSTDWSDYFDDGNEWWGTLCLTVYDGTLNRFAVIMSSATD